MKLPYNRRFTGRSLAMLIRSARFFPRFFTILCLAVAGGVGWRFAPLHGGEPLSTLVRDLGNENWVRREAAQGQLLSAGFPVTALLEEASHSTNPELSYRAKFVLSRIDPDLFEFHLLKIALSQAPRVVVVAVATGSAGDDRLVARPVPWGSAPGASPPPLSGYPEEVAYAINLGNISSTALGSSDGSTSNSSAKMEVSVTQQPQGASSLELRPIVISRQSMAVLRTGDQLLYERVGLHLVRERHPFVTLIRTRAGRKSKLSQTSLLLDPSRALEQIVDELIEDLRRGDPDTRGSSLEVASYLRNPKTSATLRALLSSSRTSPDERALVALGLDDRDMLRQVIGKPRKGEGGLVGIVAKDDLIVREDHREGGEASDNLRIRAASRLLELGDPDGLGELLDRLAEGNPSTAHNVMAELADWARRDSLSTESRRAIFEAVYAEDFLGHTIWDDDETEYLLTIAAQVFDPTMPGAKQMVTRALENLSKMARGELGPIRLRLRPCLDVWKRVRVHAPGDGLSELDFVLELLPALHNSSQVLEAAGLLESAINEGSGRLPGSPVGQLDDADLDRMLHGLLAGAQSDAVGLFPSTVTALVRVTRALTIRPGQLKRVLEAFIAVGEWGMRIQAEDSNSATPGSSQVVLQLRQVEEQLAKWALLDGASRRSGGGVFNAQTWREWIAKEGQVAQRENDIIAKGGQLNLETGPAGKEAEAKLEAGRPLVYYEFNLMLAASALQTKDARTFRVLDGCRLELSGQDSVLVEDRWGNRTRVSVRVEQNTSGSKGQPVRFVVVKSRTSLFPGMPSLSTVPTKQISSNWFEASDQFLGSRQLPGGSGSSYRTFYCVDFLDSEPSSPGTGLSASELWAWFVEKRLLDQRLDVSREYWTSVLGVLRTLRLKEGVPFLKALLGSQRLVETDAMDVAQQLLELGEPEGAAFLSRKLESANQNERLSAAMTLSEKGFAEATETLLGMAEQKVSVARAQSSRIVKALDAFLLGTEKSHPIRRKAIAFLVLKLDEEAFQFRVFTILARESGLDFGFETAQVLNDPQEKAKAVAKAIQSARAWWASQSGK